jgi:hypothetical protein
MIGWRYGLKWDGYNELVKIQNHSCAICGKREEKLLVDHCHKTMKLRSLLCLKCNTILGMANDDIEQLKSAVSYLEKWQKD